MRIMLLRYCLDTPMRIMLLRYCLDTPMRIMLVRNLILSKLDYIVMPYYLIFQSIKLIICKEY